MNNELFTFCHRDIKKNYCLSWTEFFFWIFSGEYIAFLGVSCADNSISFIVSSVFRHLSNQYVSKLNLCTAIRTTRCVHCFSARFLQTVKFMAIAPEQPIIIACIIATLI